MSDTLPATLGLDSGRGADPARYAMSGVAPRVAIRPTSREEAAEALRAAAREGLSVVPWGGGVALPLEVAPPRYEVALDLGALDRLIEFQPDDLTLTAECGITIGALRAELSRRGQELPLEAANAARATLGGALAANAIGPRRRRFGAPRDRILGARYLLGDGSTARSGGKVVKNVAGYGVHRLLCGSRGGLAVILEASLKLQPSATTRVALAYHLDHAVITDRARWAPLARLEPSALTVMSADRARLAGFDAGGAPLVGVVALEDDPAWVPVQEGRVTNALGAPHRRCEGGEAAALIERIADLEESAGARLSLTTADANPAALEPVVGARDEPDQEPTAAFVFHVLAGRLHLWPAAECGREWTDSLAEAGFTLIDRRGAGELEPTFPPHAAVLDMRSRLRDAFDPGRRFALGDRWAGVRG